ncbi:glycosyltransferase family 4 protein [Thiocapsa bogorovii]|uniref:glycosyltransferase family 4 protein n=1 Tax=Thiocapsa bogorovii TaxID=521689 RepID=UPI001E2E6C29|nr:glycosyltransferase family 4 protein [Thiocapsa bogorovii]UHD17112.1 glycosyltransferase family 4 protein [Thiocapsa bogorovii]
MPRLLAINNYYYRRGGAEVVFLESAKLLADAGWDVVPFAMKHPQNLPSPWSEYFVDEIEYGEDYSFLEKAARIPKVIYSFEARRKIRDLIRVARPDIAHAHNVYHHISPSIFGALKEEGIPTILTLHDLKLACPAYKMLTHDGICERCKGGRIWNVVAHKCVKDSYALSGTIALETLVHRALQLYSRNVERFVVPSRFYLEKFVEWGWSRDRFTYLPNFVDTTRFTPDPTPGKAFVYVGRLGHEKGLRTLIKAAALADVPLRIIGTGPEEEMLRALAEQTGGQVEFLGYLAGEDLQKAIKASRALVLPSEWYENAPISVLEAYALGRPVIGARIGGIPELIRSGETGDTFESGDEEALAAVLLKFATLNASEVTEMGMAGRCWVENNFSDARHRDRLSVLYRSLGVV